MTSLTPIVDLVEGRPMVSSLRIAEHFGRQHRNVMRDIKRACEAVSPEFAALNFEHCDYVGANGKRYPMCQLARDGFTIVVMSYTGSDAMRWKEAYIRRFNEMAALIEGKHGQPAAIAPRLATKAERRPLVDLVRMWVSVAPIGYGPAFRQVNTAMGVASVEEMTVETVQRAIGWVQERIDAIQAAPVALPAPPAPCPALPAIPDDLRERLKAHAHACMDFAEETNAKARALLMDASRLSRDVAVRLNQLFLHSPSGYLSKTRVYDAMTTFSSNGIRSIEAGTDNLYLTARLMEGLAGMR